MTNPLVHTTFNDLNLNLFIMFTTSCFLTTMILMSTLYKGIITFCPYSIFLRSCLVCELALFIKALPFLTGFWFVETKDHHARLSHSFYCTAD